MGSTGSIHLKTVSPLSIDWNVDSYYEKQHDEDDYLRSPHFVFSNASWYLKIFPNGQKNNKSVGSVELYLVKKESFIEQHYVTCTMGIKKKNGIVYMCKEFSNCLRNSLDVCGTTELLQTEELWRNKDILASENRLTVFISVQSSTADAYSQTCTEGKDIESEKLGMPYPSEDGISLLAKNFKYFLSNAEDYDVTFKVKDKEFQAHKSILVARSPVFASMFRHDMVEKRTGIVNIVDCSPEAFKELLLYLYTGTLQDLSVNIALDLYEAAVKYDLADLKTRCILFIQKDMSADTFCDVIALSVKHNESDLIKHASDFFEKNIKNILPTVEWQTFLKENPIQANELYIKVINKCLLD